MPTTGVVGLKQQGSNSDDNRLASFRREKVEQLETSIPSTAPSTSLANQLVHPLGPIYLIGQHGVSAPSCTCCRTLLCSDQARMEKICDPEFSITLAVVYLSP